MLGFGLDIPTRAMTRKPAQGLAWDLTSGSLPGAIVLSRASEGSYVTASGDIATAPIDTARFTHDLITGAPRGLLIEPARTNIISSADAQIPPWAASGATAANLALGALGVFNGCEVTSGGATWHRLNNNLGTLASSTYAICFYYRAGTSGECRVVLRDGPSTLESRLEGAAGALAISNQAAGTLSDVTETLLSDGLTYQVRALFTPSAASTYSIGLGPNSTTAGETVILLGAQIELGATTTNLIQSTTGATTRAADTVGIYGISGTYDVDITYGDGTTDTLHSQLVSDGYWPVLSSYEVAALSLTSA